MKPNDPIDVALDVEPSIADRFESRLVTVSKLPTPDPEKPPIAAAADQMDSVISALEAAISTLADKLEPVLKPLADPEHLPDEAPPTGVSGIAAQITKWAQCTARLGITIADIEERVEL